MDAVTRRDLLNGSLSLQSLDRDFRFQLGTELSVLSHVCLIRQRKSTLGPCPNCGEYLIDLDGHIALEALWRYCADGTMLSKDQLSHLYECIDCLNLLDVCQISKSVDEAKKLRRGGARPG